MTNVEIVPRSGYPLVAARPTYLDRFISYVAPRAGARRMAARAGMALASSYVGGGNGARTMRGWNPGVGSANADTLDDLPALRARSRDMARNTPLALGAVNTVVTNVVGSGLKLKALPDREVLGLSDEQAEEWESRAELIFRTWCDSESCDITEIQNFSGLQSLGCRSVLESGDLLMIRRFRRRQDAFLRTAIQLVEADRISNPRYSMDTPSIAGGVERDPSGRPVAYHVMDDHPGEVFSLAPAATDWRRVAVRAKSGRRRAILLYDRKRPDQLRGVPYLAPVMEPLKQLDRYTDAEIMAAVVSAAFTVFVRSETPEQGLAPVPGEEADDPASDLALGSGLIVDLAPGEDVTTANPARPNQAFDPFVTAVLRQIGVALELPYEVLVKHFTRSYSAARSSLLEAWKFFLTRRTWLAGSMCAPVYGWVMEEAIARGMIDAPGFFDSPVIRQAWLGASWVGPSQGQIDPLKEIQAAEKRIALGVSTHDEETAAITGGDWRSNHRQLAKEQRLRSEAGLIHADPAGGSAVESEDPDENDQTEQEAA